MKPPYCTWWAAMSHAEVYIELNVRRSELAVANTAAGSATALAPKLCAIAAEAAADITPLPTWCSMCDHSPSILVWTQWLVVECASGDGSHAALSHAFSSIARHSSDMQEKRGIILEQTIRAHMKVRATVSWQGLHVNL